MVDVLVLALGALPDLDFAAAADDANSHGGEQVVCSIGVVVYTSVEHGSGVLTNTGLDRGLATGVVIDEVGHIVDNTGDGHKTTAVLALVDIVVPFHDGKLVERGTPVEFGTLLVELLLELLDTTLFDFVGTELLQVVGESELLHGPDHPLGGVILVPLDSVAVVRGEFVVEVVVTFTEGDNGGDKVVTGRVAVIEGLFTEPVGERVDTESGLLDDEAAEDTGIDEAAHPVAPS